MRNDHAEIRSKMVFELLTTPPVPVQVELRYDTRDPYAVVATFNPDGARTVEWIFARDLLADGLIGDAGQGDVHVWPVPDDLADIAVELRSPSGYARFDASAEEVASFLDQTYDVVVPGSEHLWFDFDHEISHLGSAN